MKNPISGLIRLFRAVRDRLDDACESLVCRFLAESAAQSLASVQREMEMERLIALAASGQLPHRQVMVVGEDGSLEPLNRETPPEGVWLH